MERYRKKDMLQTTDTLLRANDIIVRTARSNPQGAAEALVQCQESAISLGTYIDTLGEKYAGLVHILEDYCENIYQMSESLSDENACRKTAKKIQKQLTSLRNGIQYDLPEDKKEVVFLPYKASMWDSLESVWKAADADPDCDAYVIPIPYFDKNPDGSFREEHYEGELYPKDVPITRYDEYDFKARRPDVIYIHNPYDECNHVTSVHPYFYAKNLRNFTDKLVYIPYFVLNEIEPDNQTAIDGMKHFCFTPGTIYADQVIVQSENMRRIYINEYMKAAKEMGLGGEHTDRKFLEKKFLGTGSPKFDKVLNTRKEDLEIPKEWLKIIEKPDGSWKKIVFYNTSVSALLKHDEQMLRKMESVFGIFKENRDVVALLWRPHPLIQATIESMRPQLWEGYREIRERYIEEGWGIYDDSAELDRAVVISDAYYGDGSSVVNLYMAAGGRVLVQEPYIGAGNTPFVCLDFIEESAGAWLLSPMSNALYWYDKRTHAIEIEYVWQTEQVTFGYGSMIKIDEKIVLAPYMETNILVYDIKNKKAETLFYGNSQREEYKFKSVIRYQNKLFLLGQYSEIAIINYDTWEIEKISLQRFCEGAVAGKWFNLWSCLEGALCRVEQYLYIPVSGENSIFEFNMLDYSGKTYKLQGEKGVYNTISFDGSSFWITGTEDYIVEWNKGTGEVIRHSIAIKEFVSKAFDFVNINYVFASSIFCDGYIWLTPFLSNMVIKVNVSTKQMEVILKVDELSIGWRLKETGDYVYFNLSRDKTSQYDIIEYFVNKEGVIVAENIFETGNIKKRRETIWAKKQVETYINTLEEYIKEIGGK